MRPHLRCVPSMALPSMRDIRTWTELVGQEYSPVFSLGDVQVVWTTEEVDQTSVISTKEQSFSMFLEVFTK